MYNIGDIFKYCKRHFLVEEAIEGIRTHSMFYKVLCLETSDRCMYSESEIVTSIKVA